MNNKRKLVNLLIVGIIFGFLVASIELKTHTVQAYDKTDSKTKTLHKDGNILGYRKYNIKVTVYLTYAGGGVGGYFIDDARIYLYTSTGGWPIGPPDMKYFRIIYDGGSDYWRVYYPSVYNYASRSITPSHTTDTVYFSGEYGTPDYMALRFHWHFYENEENYNDKDPDDSGTYHFVYDAIDEEWEYGSGLT